MRYCIEGGCPELANPKSKNGSRCTGHEKARNHTRNTSEKRKHYADPSYRAIPLIGVCVRCGSDKDLTRDHRTSLAMGGTNNQPIDIMCRRCNGSKQ